MQMISCFELEGEAYIYGEKLVQNSSGQASMIGLYTCPETAN